MDIKKEIRRIMKSGRVVVVGVGNTMRGDDGAGPYVISELNKLNKLNKLSFIDAGSAPENYIGKITGLRPKSVVIIDAMDLTLEPGGMAVVESGDIKDTTVSTHNMSLGLFAQQIKECCPARVVFIGIQPCSTDFREGLSEPVKKTADNLVEVTVHGALC